MSCDNTIVEVPLGERGYSIHIATGNLAQAGRFVSERVSTSHFVLVTDDNVVERHGRAVAENLAEHGNVDILSIEPGESAKSVATADVLWQKMLEIGADRRSVVVAVGGGVVGDLAGFIAATFARGLAFIQIPTTLLRAGRQLRWRQGRRQSARREEHGGRLLAAPRCID